MAGELHFRLRGVLADDTLGRTISLRDSLATTALSKIVRPRGRLRQFNPSRAMWCRRCHREVASVPTSDGAINCPFCGEDPLGANKSPVPAGGAETQCDAGRSATAEVWYRTDASHARNQSENERSSQRATEQDTHDPLGHENPPARPGRWVVRKLRRRSKLTGMAIANAGVEASSKTGGESASRAASRDFEIPLESLRPGSWINLGGFFVFVFLIGQVLTIWAFLAGHFGAWSLGQAATSVGLAASLWLLLRQSGRLAEQNRQLTRRLNQSRHRSQRQTHNEEQHGNPGPRRNQETHPQSGTNSLSSHHTKV